MLPVWVNDLATVVTLVTGVPVIAGWVISKAGPLRPPVAKPHRSANTGNMVRDALHEGVVHLIIRPEQPLWEDVLTTLLLSAVFTLASAFWVWNSTRPIELAWDGPLRTVGLTLLCGLGLLVCALWARVFAKRDYLHRMQ